MKWLARGRQTVRRLPLDITRTEYRAALRLFRKNRVKELKLRRAQGMTLAMAATSQG